MTDPRAEKREPVDVERNGRLLELLYRDRHGALQSIARRYGIAGDQVDDVVQSALAAVLGAYRGPADPRQLFSYTATSIRTAAAKAHRRHQRKESRLAGMPREQRNDLVGTQAERSQLDVEAPDPAETAIARERARAARERLRKLPELERTILVLGAAGYGNTEIAAITGLSERAVRKRVTRAHRRLRELAE
jgi:RNA polymerase sigma factor (sigma-70 family)